MANYRADFGEHYGSDVVYVDGVPMVVDRRTPLDDLDRMDGEASEAGELDGEAGDGEGEAQGPVSFTDLVEPGTKFDNPEDYHQIAEKIGELMARLRHDSPDALEDRFEEICKAVRNLVDRERLRTLKALLGYLWDRARSPWCVMKNVLAVTRRIRPEIIKGVSQSEVAWLLEETRAAVHAREKRTVEEFLKRWGVKGFKLFGGTKSEDARQKYKEVQKGNCNRRGGKKLRKD